MIRTLTPNDRAAITEALSWTAQQPRWLRDAEAVWGDVTVDGYLDIMRNDPQVDYGIYDSSDLHAIITVARSGEQRYNCHIMCRHRANVALIVDAGQQMLAHFRALGLQETTAWPLSRNRGMQRILEAIGFARDRVERIKGQSHGQLLTWWRFSTA